MTDRVSAKSSESGAERATASGAPAVWAGLPGNVVAEAQHGDAAAAEAAFASAVHRVVLDIVNQRLAPVTMAPCSVLAYGDEGR